MTRSPPPAGLELLDDLHARPDSVRLSLSHIARANRWFGGRAAVRWGTAALLGRRRPARLSVLDVGVGQGDVPRALASWLARRGTAATVVGVELHPVAARAAREQGVPTARADGRRLPLADRSVDVVVISQVAHHHDADGVAQLAAEAHRVARVGAVIADLRPSRAAAWGFQVASRVLGFDAATRADGVLSVARGFTAGSLRSILERAGIRATVVRRPGARVVAYWSAIP